MLNKIYPLLLSIPLAFVATTPASAISIVTYNLTGAPGNQASQAPASAATNITGLDITRGTGLGSATGTNAFNSNGFEGTGSAPSSTEFVQLGFTVASGFRVDLTDLKIITQSSGSGPGTIGLYSSVDSFNTALVSITQPSATAVSSTINLASLTGLTGTVTFRFYEIGNTRADNAAGGTLSGGTFRLNNFDSNGIVFSGTVTEVPFDFAPQFGLVVVGAWVIRKRVVRKIQELKK